jgi:hypothetical protein
MMIGVPKTEIIRLSPKKLKQLQQEVLIRDDFKCLCCGYPVNSPPHHILPTGRGGSDVAENMATICNETDCLAFNDIRMSCHHAEHHADPRVVVERMREMYPNFDELIGEETRPVRMIRTALLNIVKNKSE